MNEKQPQRVRGNILAVDDTPNNLRLLSSMLTVLGYKVRSVTEASMALAAIAASPPDLILMDVNMPETNGYDLCRTLKADAQTTDIPVIFISARDEVVDKVRAFAVGGADYITKPFQTEEVLARVENQLAIQRLKQQLQERNAQLEREIHDRIEAEKALQRANQELQTLAMMDGLTQVANRRRFDEYLQQEWQQARENEELLSLILCDIDFFKPYNDSEGHQQGDECLRAVAKELKAAVGELDGLVARYGGEEFAVVLPRTDAGQAVEIAQQMQAHIARLQIAHARSGVSDRITVSVGCATINPQGDTTPDILVSVADKALYEAKQQGRNRIVMKEPKPVTRI